METRPGSTPDHYEDILAHLQMAEELIERATTRLEALKQDALKLEQHIQEAQDALKGNTGASTEPRG